MTDVISELQACQICAGRFAATATAHCPRPVVWFEPQARILIAGQAPGMKVHRSGKPFTDASGDRLRRWMGVSADTFYDRSRIAIVPMAFCFPGYSAQGHDLPPPPICRRTWHDRVMQVLPAIRLRVIVGSYAARYHTGTTSALTEAVRNWSQGPENTFVLPHPSWRNTGWLKRNPWFDADVLPRLQRRVREILDD